MRNGSSRPALCSKRRCQQSHRSIGASGTADCSLRSPFFFTWPPAALRALAAPFVHHCEAFPRCPAHFGSVRSRSTSPRFWAVTAFSRYAERVGFALSVTRRYECALSSSAIAAHRFGKPLTMQVSRNPHFKPRRGQPVGALAASFLSLAAGTQSRTDDKAIRPALHEAGS
jgi:hypothetical protein